MQLFNEHSRGFNVAVRFWLLRQSVQTEPTSNHESEHLVESACDLEDSLVEIVQLQLSLAIHYHLLFLLIEKLPNACNGLEVVFGNLVEVGLARGEFFLGLLLHHFEIKAEEALNLGDIASLQRLERLEKLVKRL